jgi:UDP-N-acetylmuramoyl-L-alanyl-D-glutamate--2,6-diaminopimelate ligase
MLLADLLPGVPGVKGIRGSTGVEIIRIVSDSRQAGPGALFVAYVGTGVDGHRFIADAVARGAAAVVGERPPEPGSVPYVTVEDGRLALAWLSAAWHGHPGRAMSVVGITGTDGKTTTANFLHCILLAGGARAGLISTVNAVIGGRSLDTGLHTTTPDAPDVQRYLALMRDARTEVAILETTSHGLAQHRVAGCDFDVAVVTNITHEHLDFHGSYEAYRAAKALLFRSLAGSVRKPGGPPKTAVLNADDASFRHLAAIPAERHIVYGLDPAGRIKPGLLAAPEVWTLAAERPSSGPDGVAFDLVIGRKPGDAPEAPLPLRTRLLGSYNVHNMLAAAGAALALDIGRGAVREGIAALEGVPGRMEPIARGQPFAAIVDFAHTPNALARALETAREIAGPRRRVIVVFGSAGLRDRAKRRLMGEVAARLADFTVITAEDPRTEALADILSETAQAMREAGRREPEDFLRVEDRQLAILAAARHAAPGDVLIVCGKGHEESMCFGTVEHPWRDQAAVSWALGRLSGVESGSPPYLLPTWTPLDT